MPWVKFHIALLDNDAFKRLRSNSRLTFAIAILLAGKQRQNGALYIRGSGPMSVAEIANYTGLPKRDQQKALDELTQRSSFMTLRDDGTYVVERFSEKAGESSTERVRQHRARRRSQAQSSGSAHEVRFGNADETLQKPLRNALEEDVEQEQDESERAHAIDDKEPTWATSLRGAMRESARLDCALSSLDGDDHLTLGRYLAYRVQLDADERANRKTGLRFAAQLAEMSADARLCVQTPREVIGATLRAIEAGAEIASLWDLKPWLLEGVIGARRAS